MKTTQIVLSLRSGLNRNLAGPLCLAVLLGLALSACQEQEKVGGTQNGTGAGVYTLVSVNGAKVPTKVSHDGHSLEVRSGAFTINADGTCASKMVIVPPSGTEVTRDVTATYTREGAKLRMQWEGAGRTEGTLANGTFKMNNEGMILEYRKQ